ncbi:UvrD-helicase domain-containing protein [Solibacillus sp. MA9]|uniref:UvrD-helicase domain-containing protein n=1 Tax=Solibacillus palustris TaxID=2908203 RepID=A0ABS9UGN0_9BACL|nr:RNA polymerase recycling motor HelD [Solibacillus sp. MA9]MCH7323516.1 UvrD-helicase domain-containing protein [Solibacillus sp. MA9]
MSTLFQQEQQHLQDVLEVVDQQTQKLKAETSKRQQEVVSIRRHFWDEVKINTDTFDDFLETVINLRQETQALAVGETTYDHVKKRLSTLQKMQNAPYFARIDLKEQGMNEAEPIYIGISSLMDETGEDFIVYDWRAPVLSVYYDDEPGHVSYKTPSGTVEGELEKKWQYLIRNGKLISMFDTSLTIVDELLQEVLGQGTNKQMQSIVSTIQREQNKLIRHEQGRILIVHGAAGSGKTSAALQRIAYLLYKHRATLKADQVLLFSPNGMFNSYVANVLPELGEENMQQTTFQEYLQQRIDGDFTLETAYEQLETLLTNSLTEKMKSRFAAIHYKASTAFFAQIEQYFIALTEKGMQFKPIVFRGEEIVSANEISQQFYMIYGQLPFAARLEKIQQGLINTLKKRAKYERTKNWVQEEMELLSDVAFEEARRYFARKKGFKREEVEQFEMSEQQLAQLLVARRFKPLREAIEALEFIDIPAIYEGLFDENTFISQDEHWAEICQVTKQQLASGILLYEDATPYVLLKEWLVGMQVNRQIKYIFIDEAQDYAPFQFEVLKRLFPAAKFTILGDFNQGIFSHAHQLNNFEHLIELFGEQETTLLAMHRSYRSTKSIIEFTRQLIPEGQAIIPFNRAGDVPTLTILQSRQQLHEKIQHRVVALQQQGMATIAIICQSAQESKDAYEGLASSIDQLKLMKSGSAEYEQGVIIIPAYLAKGIEFDAVVIYDASKYRYGQERVRRLLYTACTRAMHQLTLYSLGEPSGFLHSPCEQDVIQTIVEGE